MKRIGNLWSEIASFHNLLSAVESAAAGKRTRPDVAGFLLNLEGEILQLLGELAGGSYRPARLRPFGTAWCITR